MNEDPSPRGVPSSSGVPRAEDRELPPGRQRALREHLMREIESRTGSSTESRTEIRTEGAGDTGPGARRFWRRPAFVAPAVAAAVTVAVVVGGTVTRYAAVPSEPGAASTADRRGGTPSDESAGALLEWVAEAAGKRKLPQVGDDQFVYTEQEDYHWKMDVGVLAEGCVTTQEAHPSGLRETWVSVDGRRAGLMRRHDDGSEVTGRVVAEQLVGKYVIHNFRQAEDELPVETEGMYRYLYGLTSADERPSGGEAADRDAFEKAVALLTGQLLPPGAEAALYRALARVPGLTVYEGAVDAAGRTGVAVGIEGAYPGDFAQSRSRHELLFDDRTLRFLGMNSINLDAPDDRCESLDAGDLVSSVAILERGVVDRTGQRP
ncbi:CU044_5270 family protein [Streptomyces europaeiscabiei]|uniref:CU044_5270 family protein n=1 Tax=Streptomyces europaeiscabiei TaxID=146819 RepID=UPI000A69C510|nr:CU044_5270 family protein [Streptomyces europaeiscabiei]MDX2770094.1 CU044_5270 family protein [Streptomyces europaeiscabiei]MDX3671619.1 CU044_5270 family protein [Streptomyces europaeiscabiei]